MDIQVILQEFDDEKKKQKLESAVHADQGGLVLLAGKKPPISTIEVARLFPLPWEGYQKSSKRLQGKIWMSQGSCSAVLERIKTPCIHQLQKGFMKIRNPELKRKIQVAEELQEMTRLPIDRKSDRIPDLRFLQHQRCTRESHWPLA